MAGPMHHLQPELPQARHSAGPLGLLMVIYGLHERRAAIEPTVSVLGKSSGIAIWQQVRRLALLAIPVTLGALAVPALSVVDAFTVPRLLQKSGMEAADAMTLFGLYGRGQPLVQLVVMVAGAMGAALVPALAAARARKDAGAVKRQADLGDAGRLGGWRGRCFRARGTRDAH